MIICDSHKSCEKEKRVGKGGNPILNGECAAGRGRPNAKPQGGVG